MRVNTTWRVLHMRRLCIRTNVIVFRCTLLEIGLHLYCLVSQFCYNCFLCVFLHSSQPSKGVDLIDIDGPMG